MLFIIASILMTVDHIGYTFFPEIMWMRIIGRLAMPIYAYGVARGYVSLRTRPEAMKRYLDRMVLCAIISQIPFSLLIGPGFNVCITWCFGIGMLTAIDAACKFYAEKKPAFMVLSMLAVIMIPQIADSIHMDYGVFGVLNVVAYSLLRKDKDGKFNTTSIWVTVCVLCFLNVTNFARYIWNGSPDSVIIWKTIEMVSIFAVPIIVMLDKKVHINRYIKYSFYPVHMLVLYVVHQFI